MIARKYGDMCETLEPQDDLEAYLATKELLRGIFGTVPNILSTFISATFLTRASRTIDPRSLYGRRSSLKVNDLFVKR